MALAKGKIIRVVGRSYLDRAGSEVAADPFVKNDRNFAAYQRQAKFLSMQTESSAHLLDEWQQQRRRASFQGALLQPSKNSPVSFPSASITG